VMFNLPLAMYNYTSVMFSLPLAMLPHPFAKYNSTLIVRYRSFTPYNFKNVESVLCEQKLVSAKFGT
ncbi:MAG: hypothetical protein QM541_14655, partial [Flavobacterium sp.]|nr:hypothetical protein [Flavobacterium sp.]